MNRKPGRPKAIPENSILDVLSLYGGGLGYRAIARELRSKGISTSWSTVRRTISIAKARKPVLK
jgi:repressor of nif and glnA expression